MMRRPSLVLAAVLVASPSAFAQVIEPNGAAVPRPAPIDETSIQEYFDAQNEPIDAIADASAEPGAFSPLCDFSATVVLAEAMAADGLAWYNVPASTTARPAPLYSIVPETARVTGQVFTGADILNDPNYAGGLIGFALMQDGSAIYYSEYQRNVNCTQCSMPGYWKMMLSYRSVAHENAYYLGFEDWAGASSSSWGDNDGDFQDKLFLVTGITCAGGGEPCDTGKPGICAAGLTECTPNGAPTCRQQQMPKDETCNNIDDDCDGDVDDGDLCPADEVCVRGQCVARCNTGEFSCPPDLVCGADGFCIDPACRDVTCGPGLACRGGQCVGICQGVICPLGQVCMLDRCVDPCSGVTCPEKTFCHRGVCIGDCECNGCPAGEECAPDGQCVAPGCAGVACPATQACRDGACVPACDGAVCPVGVTCENGVCGEPPAGGSGGTSGTAGSSGSGGTVVATGGVAGVVATGGNPETGGTAGVFPTSGSGGDELGSVDPPGYHSCACRTLPGPRDGSPKALLLALSGLALALRRRKRERSAS
ncbi:MAG TPA: hypothetical protein VF103_04325 [Polyangiaceae bacterium]